MYYTLLNWGGMGVISLLYWEWRSYLGRVCVRLVTLLGFCTN